jgi:membrane-associated protease RseP (regulator of RpoE activity)
MKVTFWEWRKIHRKKNQKWRHQVVSVMNIISFNKLKLKYPSLQNTDLFFGFKIVNINGTETTDKDKTIRKIWVNDARYKTDNTSNMSTHLR